jgi:hypothetical protein
MSTFFFSTLSSDVARSAAALRSKGFAFEECSQKYLLLLTGTKALALLHLAQLKGVAFEECSIFSLYYYDRTNTGTHAGTSLASSFCCSSSAILLYWYKSTCCCLLVQKYLLYWYKSTCFTLPCAA